MSHVPYLVSDDSSDDDDDFFFKKKRKPGYGGKEKKLPRGFKKKKTQKDQTTSSDGIKIPSIQSSKDGNKIIITNYCNGLDCLDLASVRCKRCTSKSYCSTKCRKKNWKLSCHNNLQQCASCTILSTGRIIYNTLQMLLKTQYSLHIFAFSR